MSFDLYAHAAAPAKPPLIPGFDWRAETDGTWTCHIGWISGRMWEQDYNKLRHIGIDVARYSEGAGAYNRLRFTPGLAPQRRVEAVVAELLQVHAGFIAERARIDAGHAARAQRAATAMARAKACLEKYPLNFSRNPRIRELIEGYPSNTILLELDRLAVATEAAAVKKGIAR